MTKKVEVSLLKLRVRAETIHVSKSFQTILAEHLERLSAAPSEAARASASVHLEGWMGVVKRPRATPPPARAYASEMRAATELIRRRQMPRPEPIIAEGSLSGADREDLRRLVALGGTELTEGLSAGRLKKAYRRLARLHHPDARRAADGAPTHESFLEVRTRYVRLQARVSAIGQSCNSR